jgi:hypothetical protein
MKTILATLILSELALAFLLVAFVFGHFDSPNLARAWGEHRRNPSPETEAAFNKEKSATDRMIFVLNAGVGLLLAVNSYALFKVIRKVATGNQSQAKPRPV